MIRSLGTRLSRENAIPRRRRFSLVACGVLTSVLPALLPACGQKTGTKSVAVQTYTVRGQIVQLPDPARPAMELQIRHEAIPSFVDKSGAATGMKQMTMPFPTAPGVSLENLAVDDKVELVFEVRWTGTPLYQVTRITPLPKDTRLQWDTDAIPQPTRPDADR